MDCYSAVLLYVNDTLISIDSVSLLGSQTVYFSFAANGETWIMNAIAELPAGIYMLRIEQSDPVKIMKY